MGTVGSCELAYETLAAMRVAEPDSIIMLSGLCHYTVDHFLVPVAYRETEGPVAVRLRRSDILPGQVELRELAQTHATYWLRRETGERMLAALEQNDFEAFLELAEPLVARERIDGRETGLSEADRERLTEARTEFEAAVAAYRASGDVGRGREVLLYERWPDEDGVTSLEGADPDTAAYVCRFGDGTDESDLPVLADDIDNDPSRPYFCVYTTDYTIFREGTVPSASVPLFEYGFLERPD